MFLLRTLVQPRCNVLLLVMFHPVTMATMMKFVLLMQSSPENCRLVIVQMLRQSQQVDKLCSAFDKVSLLHGQHV